MFPFALYAWLLFGLPFGLVLAIRDSERQRDAVRNLSEAMEQSHSAVMIVDLSSRIEYANAGLCRQCGYERRELIGGLAGLPGRQGRPRHLCGHGGTVRAGRTWNGEWTNKRKNGELYPARES